MVGKNSLVTVVMPVYNALPYLDRAIASITAQTMVEFEFKIYDDHSTDGSYERALEWAARDRRISVQRGTVRLGPCGSSQRAAAMAASEFVARMDADDIASADRLETQLAVMEGNPEAVLCASVFDMIDREDRVIRAAGLGHASGPNPPVAHASIFYRRDAFDRAGGYCPGTDYFEDQDLYRRMAAIGRFLVIERPLLQLRFAGQHARLRDDRLAVLRQIDRMHQPADAGQGSRSLRAIHPVTFYTVAVLATLGLERPRLLGAMLRRVTFTRPGLLLGIMTFVALCELSPRVARGCNHAIAALRARPRRARESGQHLSEWRWRGQEPAAPPLQA